MGFLSYEFTVTEEPRFLLVTVEGIIRAHRNERTLRRIAKETKRRSATKMLLDVRGLVGQWEAEDRYDAGVFFASEAFVHIRVAVLDREERVNHFAEWVAVSRGADVRGFSEEPKALAWLLRE